MKKNIKFENNLAKTALSVLNTKKPKNESEKERLKVKSELLLLSNQLLNEKKINKTTYNKMFDLFMSQARINALTDAYSSLTKINESTEAKVHKNKDFKAIKQEEKAKRETKEGKVDKFMMLMSKTKNKKLYKYHLTANIERKITYTSKKGKVSVYKEHQHNKKLVGYDNLVDSRVVEASSLEEAQKLFSDMISLEQEYEEYSSAAKVDVDQINFIDDSPVVEHRIQRSNPANMPLREASYIEYNFTEQETKYLSTENTCVIDNLVGLYEKELKIDREKLIQINKKFHGVVETEGEPEFIESDLDDLVPNPNYNEYNKIPRLEAKIKEYEKAYETTQHDYYKNEIIDLKLYLEDIKTTCKPDNYYDITNAFTPAFIDYFCKLYGISHYAYDINKTCFMKYVHKSRNHRALCYYAMNNHMYLVKNKDLVKSMVEKAKDPEHKFNTSSLEFDEVVNHFNGTEIYVNETMENVKANLKNRFNCVYMYSRSTKNINDIFEQFITVFNTFPIIKKCNKTNIMEFHFKTIEDNMLIFCCDPNDINVITYKEVKELYDQNKMEWKNQTYTGFITQLKEKFYDELNGRFKFTKEQKDAICKKFGYQCNICKCCIKTEKYEIDHVRALGNGGNNEEINLQPLCKACHLTKTSTEHETGQYIKIKDTESTFNAGLQEVMDSPLSQVHAFVEKAYFKPLEEDKIIYTIDINKCRKNILYYGDYDYCVFTVFDKVEEFKGTKIRPGLYYIESENYIPLRCNGWYYHNMVVYCLQNDIIKLENIKFVIKSSLTLKKDHYNKFIDYCYSNIKNYEKLAINSMIGNFKPNVNKRERWNSGIFTSNSDEAFNSYLKNNCCFIDVKVIDDKRYYHTFQKMYNTNIETESPIYNQILQQEQIELHQLGEMIKQKGGIILDYNTDAINCAFPDNKFPFDLVEEIQLKNHYWDEDNTVYKYKIEHGKERLKNSRMQETMRTDTFKEAKYYNWRLTPDVHDNDFEPLVNKVIDSNESWFITGPGGSGKTTLLKMLQERLNEADKKYVTLCPTNLAALLVDGETLHKFSAKLKKSSCVKNLDLDYIFIDEVSMVQEVFYKFLMMIKKIKPNIKFIISGDYNQLKPVNDRISQYTDYSNAPCLFELADYNKIELTKCRRANDTLYNLVKFNNVPNLKPSDFKETKDFKTNIHLCFTNETRKHINRVKMEEQNVKKHWKGLKLDALPYDKRTQYVILNKDVPIISKVNCEEMNLINNQRFKIKKIGPLEITIVDEAKNERKIYIRDFQKHFLVAYATTIHSSQGMSISEPYTIHEWERLDQRLKYVALSRSREHSYINVFV